VTRSCAVVCFGEALGRLSTEPGQHLLGFANRLELHVGGAELNVAAALSGFGRKTTIVTALPDNPLGDRALVHLRSFGVDTRAVVRGEGRLGLYFVDTGASQRVSRITYDRANSIFATHDWSGHAWRQTLEGAAVLHVSGITLAVSTNACSAAFDAMRAAREMGVMVSFDANFRPALWVGREADGAAAFSEALALSDLAFVDHRDAAMVLGNSPGAPVEVMALFDAFPYLTRIAHTYRRAESVGIQHLAARFVTRAGQDITTEEVRIEDVVDRIGSGDAFAAGILYAILCDDQAADIAQMGLAAACLKHSQRGDALAATAEDLRGFWTQSDVRR